MLRFKCPLSAQTRPARGIAASLEGERFQIEPHTDSVEPELFGLILTVV